MGCFWLKLNHPVLYRVIKIRYVIGYNTEDTTNCPDSKHWHPVTLSWLHNGASPYYHSSVIPGQPLFWVRRIWHNGGCYVETTLTLLVIHVTSVCDHPPTCVTWPRAHSEARECGRGQLGQCGAAQFSVGTQVVQTCPRVLPTKFDIMKIEVCLVYCNM